MKSLWVGLLICAVCPGQDPRGAVVGQVSDSSGSSVPNASVRATHSETNVVTGAVTNAQGNYELLYLLPGVYNIAVEHAGFKGSSQQGVAVRIGDRIRIDVRLEVGNIAESVQVTAQAPVLESTTATVGQVMSTRQVSEMPLRSGSLAWLFTMAPGVVLQALPYDGPWNIDQSSQINVGGGGNYSADFNVDGVSNNSYGGRTAFVPPPDAVQEVRVNTTAYDAALGHTTGGSIEVTLKSGTNALHGSVGASVSSGPMQTRNFFTNKFIFDPATGPITPEKIKDNTPSVRWLRENITVGGPAYIPKVYNGRNKTFWMFSWQSHLRSRPVATQNTVPTEAQRGGDFSALLALGAQYQIYDPFSTQPSGASRFQRQPLPRNIIPASRIDAAAKTILGYFPAPNNAGTRDGLNNYLRTRQETQDLYQPLARIDHNFSDKNRLFGRYTQSNFYGHFDELVPDSKVRGRLRKRPHRGAALDDVYVISPELVLDVRYGFTWFEEYQSYDNIGWDLSEFGFPKSLTGQLDPRAVTFPQISVSGLLQLGNDGGFQQRYSSHSLLSVLNWSRGNHSMKFGWDFRTLLESDYIYGNVSPRLDFAETYTRGPLDNSPVSPNGQGLASFLFGIPTGGFVDTNDSRAELSRYHGLFYQDDWRIAKRLTLNLGLRWEYETPMTERFNRATRDFDFTTPNPIQAQAQAAYARSPIPEVPASQFRVLGGLTFLGVNGNPRGLRNSDPRAFMPRFGYAYQLRQNVVLRGGYGLFFGLLGADYEDFAQPGFNQRTNVVASPDNGQTYAASIRNPLPGGLEKPRGAADGLTTFLGLAPAFFSSDGRRPYTQRWSQSIQWMPASGSVFEVGYLGARSVRLRVPTQFDPIPARYLSTSPVRDQATIDFLSARVNSPFVGLNGFAGTAFATSTSTTRSQLLRPYPQFTGLSTGLPAGSSWYDALTLRFERRFSRGFQVMANYTWSKTMEAVAYRNDTDSLPEHGISSLDRPHRVAAMAMWDLPIHTRGFLGQAVNGWQVQTIVQMQSGPGLAFGNVIYRGTYSDLKISGDARSLEQWFNTGGFERNTQLQLANNIRTFPTRLAGVRSDGISTVDLSAIKNFRIREGLRVQLRGEAEGAMNHPNFAAPNLNPANSLFGKVSATQTGQEERRIFVGLKVVF